MKKFNNSILTRIFLIIIIFTSTITAEIKTLTISYDSRSTILFEHFGFTHTGQLSIKISAVALSSSLTPPSPSRVGFFLLSDEALSETIAESTQNPESFCVLDSKYIRTLFKFERLSLPPASSFNQTFPVTTPKEYSLFFANCNPESAVSMEVRTEMFNLDNGVKDYLSVGLTQLPTLFTLFSLVYIGFLGYWVLTCFKNKLMVHRIHMLMGSLLLMKSINLICAAIDKHYVKVTGTPHGWNVLFYIFQFIREILLFTVIVLIGTGWSFLKPFLQEKKVLMVVIPLQVLANIASVVVDETGPFNKDWVSWNQLLLFVDIICCCAILFPIVWYIRALKETSKTDGKAARNWAKLTLFRQFYIVVVGYLYFTRIIVFALRIIVAYKYQWVSNAAEEIASLVLYTVMFYMFRPVERNGYFAKDDEEEEVAMAAPRDDEFDIKIRP